MNIKKQTAVEWLVKELNQKIDFIPMNKWDEIKEVIEKAKAMEKEQMIDFGFDTYCFISGIMNVPFEQLSENRLNAENNYKEIYEH